MTTFNDLEFKPHPHAIADDDVQAKIHFPNGYEASVIKTGFSYGGSDGHYELAVLHDGKLVYDTPVTDDVLGWLTPEQVSEHLAAIAALPAREVPDAGVD